MKKIKVNMKKKYKIPLILLVVAIFIIIILIVLQLFISSEEEGSTVVDTIDKYGYTLDARDTELMKNTYNELKQVLLADEVDFDSYATLLSELFVIDLFTMDNKVNKYDVGSTEYIYPDAIDNFKTNVEETIYKTLEDNTDGKRKQDLPIVKSIIETTIDTTTYEIDEVEYEGYIVTISWDYEDDLGYDSDATITLINEEDILYIVEYSEGIIDE